MNALPSSRPQACPLAPSPKCPETPCHDHPVIIAPVGDSPLVMLCVLWA